MVKSAFPILLGSDLARVLDFYVSVRGGMVAYQFPPSGPPDYVGIDLGESPIGLGGDPALTDGPSGRFALWLYVDDCDATVTRLREAGAPVVAEPEDQPWGERVARVLDPDGNMVIIGQQG